MYYLATYYPTIHAYTLINTSIAKESFKLYVFVLFIAGMVFVWGCDGGGGSVSISYDIGHFVGASSNVVCCVGSVSTGCPVVHGVEDGISTHCKVVHCVGSCRNGINISCRVGYCVGRDGVNCVGSGRNAVSIGCGNASVRCAERGGDSVGNVIYCVISGGDGVSTGCSVICCVGRDGNANHYSKNIADQGMA